MSYILFTKKKIRFTEAVCEMTGFSMDDFCEVLSMDYIASFSFISNNIENAYNNGFVVRTGKYN